MKYERSTSSGFQVMAKVNVFISRSNFNVKVAR